MAFLAWILITQQKQKRIIVSAFPRILNSVLDKTWNPRFSWKKGKMILIYFQLYFIICHVIKRLPLRYVYYFLSRLLFVEGFVLGPHYNLCTFHLLNAITNLMYDFFSYGSRVVHFVLSSTCAGRRYIFTFIQYKVFYK